MDNLAERVTQLSPSVTTSITSKAKAMASEGVDICVFAAGEPDFETPDYIKAAAAVALEEGFTRYTPSSGLPALREAICEKLLTDNDLGYEPNQVTVSNGAKQAIQNAILAVCDPGDEVIIPAPYWLSYPEIVRIAGASPRIVPTSPENGWKITADQFEENMSPRTKMIILNSPSNPAGSVYTKEEIEAIVEVAEAEDIMILSDEVYEKLIYEDAKHVSVAAVSPRAYDLTITVNGFSKAYSMAGWRIGYTAAPDGIARAIDNIQSHMTGNVCSFAQKGAIAALKAGEQDVEDMRQEFDLRRGYMFNRLQNISNVSVVKPYGAFYMLANISQTDMSSVNFAEALLSKANVAVVPGAAFGDDRTIRFSYATGMDVIKKGMDRFEEFCKGY